MPATDSVDIANAALSMCGVDPIASFAEDSDPARFINLNYEFAVQNEMSLYPWPFARKNQTINLLADAPTDTTWTSAFQLPADVLTLRAVEVLGFMIDYELVSNQVHCNAVSNDTVVITYTARLNEAAWPPFFVQLIILRLATIISLGLTEQPTRAEAIAAQAENQLARARYESSTQETTKRIPAGDRLISARHSGVTR